MMKLFYANTSPYARKVRIVAAEKELDDRIEFVLCNPFAEVPELKKVNPLSKVPSLLSDDGEVLYDSPVICEYLDSLVPGNSLIPQGAARWSVLRLQALGDGILDAAFSLVMERRRPESEQSSSWIQRWTQAIDRSLNALEGEIEGFSGDVNLAHVTTGTALGYLDFRLADIDWRTPRPRMVTWYDTFSGRPSMIRTRPDQ